MYDTFSLMSFYTETSLHAGGETSLSLVDKPIQREKYTDFPFIASSGVKGAVRDWFKQNHECEKKEINCVFGPETDGSDFAGAVSFSDARLLLFPVKSIKGVYGYITCPFVINRLYRDLARTGFDSFNFTSDDTIRNISLLISMKYIKSNDTNLENDGKIVLEDYPLEALEKDGSPLVISEDFSNFLSLFLPDGNEYEFFRGKVKKDTVIISDDDFADFVKNSTEIQTRNRIGEGKSTDTEKGGNLFTQENLLPDTLFYTMINAGKPYCETPPDDVKDSDKIIEFINNINGKRFQIGGDETIGKGIVKTKLLNLATKEVKND